MRATAACAPVAIFAGSSESARVGGDLGKVFWGEEYIVNARIGSYPKPYVAYMDGIVMGGGVGLACHSSHRVVTEKTRIGMPEVSLWLLSGRRRHLAAVACAGRSRDLSGADRADRQRRRCRLCKTRRRVRADDAVAGSAQRTPPRHRAARPSADVQAIIDRFATPVSGGPIAANRDLIDRSKFLSAAERPGLDSSRHACCRSNPSSVPGARASSGWWTCPSGRPVVDSGLRRMAVMVIGVGVAEVHIGGGHFGCPMRCPAST